jgi:adenylate cyclase
MLAGDAAARPTMEVVARELAGDGEPARPRSRRRLAIAAGVVALAAATSLVGWRALRPPPPSGRAPASIAVMPFSTVGDPAAAYFSAGVTEDITSMLARAPDLTVLSNTATLPYRDTKPDPRRLGRELGVSYLLEGSVRKDERQVRITARLVDTRTGADVWGERLDRTGTDPWALQDEIAGHIVGALTGELGQVKRAQYREAWGADSTNLDVYDVYLRGHELYMRFTPDDNDRAGQVWRDGLARFPDSPLLMTKLGFHHFMRPYLFLRGEAAADYARAGELARAALARPGLSPLENRLAHWLSAYTSAQEGDHDRALREMEITLSLAPHDMFQLGDLGTIPILAGRPDEALRMCDRAMAADPANREFYQQLRGWALSVAGRHAESMVALDQGLKLPMVPLLQAVNLVELGRLEEARREVSRALARQPDLSLAKWRDANFYRDRSIVERQLADLAEAGLR